MMRQTIGWLMCLVSAAVLVSCSDSSAKKKAYFENGEKLLKEKKFQEAIVELRNAVQQDEKFGEARLKLADAYMSAGNPQAAYREYMRAADLLPKNNDAQIKAATILIVNGQFEDARTRIQALVDREPTNVQAQLILGNALAGLKDMDGAVREIEEAIKLDPARGVIYSTLAEIRMAQGQK